MSLLLIATACLAIGFALWRIGRRARFFVHTFQLFGYSSPAFSKWLFEHFRDAVLRLSHLLGIAILASAMVFDLSVWLTFLLWAIAFASSRRYRRDKPKKTLVWTPRVKRLTGIAFAVTLLLALAPRLILSGLAPSVQLLLGLWLADFMAPFVLLAAALIARPIERSIQEGFKTQARAHLASRPDLGVIAITGSYGKTSVKFAIREILSQRFPTLATPGSFNTPMGICRVINSDLSDEHRFAVLEMGMRHPGDIAELCAIARPDVAVVTSVGPAHLEYMGSIEAIAREKASLLSFLKTDGIAILNGDDPRVLAMKEGLKHPAIVVSASNPEADIWASDLSYGPKGARFLVHAGEEAEWFTTQLLGRHNVSNILLAIAVGQTAGMNLRQMSHAIARLEPIEHRLKLLQRGGLNILDDAFNSNPVGAANAVEVLGQFNSGQRIIITPGMIELGEQEADLNRVFGTNIAANADVVLLVGPKRTLPIAAGLEEAGFPMEHLHVMNSLFEAQDWIAGNTKEGDTVLFENDLPDQFNEG